MSETSGRVELLLGRSTGFTLECAFDLPSTGFTILFGPSGCGKTTVLRCVAGLEHARGVVRTGSAVWQDDSKGVFLPTCERRLGYVFQEASLFAHLDVRSNLEYGIRRRRNRAQAAEGQKHLAQAVELLGIGHLLPRRVSELSGGERQRCAIARALTVQPEVLLMDEPLAALDPMRRREILPWLEKLRGELQIPVLYVTHSENELLRLGGSVAFLREGKLVSFGPVERAALQVRGLEGMISAAGALLSGRVAGRDAAGGEMHVECGENLVLTLPDSGEPEGARLRLRVSASGVMLLGAPQAPAGVRNVFECTVTSVEDGGAPSQAAVRLLTGGLEFLCTMPRAVLSEIRPEPGRTVRAVFSRVEVLR